MLNKADDSITVFAEEVTAKGYQVLSFDLPEYGDRKDISLFCSKYGTLKTIMVN